MVRATAIPLTRRRTSTLLGIGSLHIAFDAPSNSIATIGSLGFSLHTKRALNVMNRSNSNGSRATFTLVNLLTTGKHVNKSTAFGKHRVLGLPRRRLGGLHTRRVSVVFRSPVASLGPCVHINRRLVRILVLRGGVDGTRTFRRSIQVLSTMGVPRTHGHVGVCPRRFSNNVHRQIVVTVTLLYQPGLLVTSRPAATLSIAMRTRVVALLGRLGQRFGATVVVVARSLNIITKVYSGILMVCTKHAVRCNGTHSIFCRPIRPCSVNLLGTIPHLSTRNRAVLAVPNGPPGLLQLPGNYPFRPHYPRTVRVYDDTPPLRRFAPNHLHTYFGPIRRLL